MTSKKWIKEHKKSIGIILFLIVGISSIYLLFFSGALPDRVTKNWLTIEGDPFVDNVDDGETLIGRKIDGYSLDDFRVIGSDYIGDGVYLYYSEVVFSAIVMHYTKITKEDAFIGLNMDHKTSILMLHLVGFPPLTNTPGRNNAWYIHVPDISWNALHKHEYNGYTPLRLSINGDLSGLEGKTVNGVEIKGTEFLYKFTGIRRVSDETGLIGQYEDIFIDAGPSEGKVTATPLRGAWSGPSDVPVVAQRLNSMNLGWNSITDPIFREGYIQQKTIDVPGVSLNPTQAGPLSIQLPVRIRPQISDYVRYTSVTHCDYFSYRYDCFLGIGNGIIGTPSAVTTPYPTTAGVRVDNVYIKEKYEFRVSLVATVHYDSEAGGTDFNNPTFEQGDVIWDTTMQGATDVDISIQDEFDLFDLGNMLFEGLTWIITVVITLGVIYIVIKGLPVIKTIARRGD